jgi:hypothetical protein
VASLTTIVAFDGSQLAVICCRGLRPASGAVDRDLWQWYCEARAKQQGNKVSKSMVQARAKWAFHQAGITNFKVNWEPLKVEHKMYILCYVSTVAPQYLLFIGSS